MKALVKVESGYGHFQILNRDVPKIKDDEVLLKVKSAGICGTDLKIYDGSFECKIPVIPGHEFSGDIVEIGKDVQGLYKGQRATAEQHFLSCGKCPDCLTGHRQWCKNKRSPGYMLDGAFAEYIAVRQDLIHVLPDSLSYDDGALVEPMGIACYAVYDRLAVKPGETILILGCGPIAIMALQFLMNAGVKKVYVSGVNADEKMRFAVAKRYGASRIINVEKENLTETIYDETDGRGVDAAIDLSGAPSAILDGLKCLRKGGKFCAVGLTKNDLTLSWETLVKKCISIVYSYSSDYQSWETCLSLMQRGAVDVSEFKNNVYPLEEWEKAFEVAKNGDALKSILHI